MRFGVPSSVYSWNKKIVNRHVEAGNDDDNDTKLGFRPNPSLTSTARSRMYFLFHWYEEGNVRKQVPFSPLFTCTSRQIPSSFPSLYRAVCDTLAVTHTHTHAHSDVYLHTHMWTHLHKLIHNTRTYSHIHLHRLVHIHSHTYMLAYPYTSTLTYAHILTYVYTHNTHTGTLARAHLY